MPTTKSTTRQPPMRATTRRQARLARPVQNRGLEQLRRRFEAFRSTNPPATRIPVTLRKAVLTLLEEGVTRTAVENSCGVSFTQMDQWLELYGPQPRSRNAVQSPRARVFSVVDADWPLAEPSVPPMQALELRLGDWSVTVRPFTGAQ
jgi:hypothetical protein